MMFRLNVLFVWFSCFVKAQVYKELSDYAAFYNQKLEDFQYFMRIPPAVMDTGGGLRKMVYDAGDHHIGIEEDGDDPGKIGEIFVFKNIENPQQGFKEWQYYLNAMNLSNDLSFVHAMFDDGLTQKMLHHPDELLELIKSRNVSETMNYGVTFRKGIVYHSLFVVQNNLIFTVHHAD